MKGDTADKLNVKVSHAEDAPTCLADGCERLGKNIVESFVVVFETVLKLGGFRLELFVGEFFVLLFVPFHLIGDCVEFFNVPAIVAAGYKRNKSHYLYISP